MTERWESNPTNEEIPQDSEALEINPVDNVEAIADTGITLGDVIDDEYEMAAQVAAPTAEKKGAVHKMLLAGATLLALASAEGCGAKVTHTKTNGGFDNFAQKLGDAIERRNDQVRRFYGYREDVDGVITGNRVMYSDRYRLNGSIRASASNNGVGIEQNQTESHSVYRNPKLAGNKNDRRD